jgi:5-formyltetrahydrofolate cyclo-ligase
MTMGLDYSKILLILVLVLIFFGSKEIPNFMRQAARFIGKIRMYSEKVRHEINEIAKIDEPIPSYEQDVVTKKNVIRDTYIAKRKELSDEQRSEKSAAIWKNLMQDPVFINAKSVMMYVEIGAEVMTRQAIRDMYGAGKRIVLPFVHEDSSMGIGEITDIDKDVIQGPGHILEPVHHKRNNFFKSDIQMVICPAVAFDMTGARLGRGKGSYDKFLKELKGRIPIFGLAFECQIMGANERLPFAYHDVVMDQVVTERGYCIVKPEDAASQAEAPSQLAG